MVFTNKIDQTYLFVINCFVRHDVVEFGQVIRFDITKSYEYEDKCKKRDTVTPT